MNLQVCSDNPFPNFEIFTHKRPVNSKHQGAFAPGVFDAQAQDACISLLGN